jgi:hypothetical protein
MRRLSLLNATPCLALLALAVGCAMDAGSDSGPLYEGDSASAGGTAAGDPSGDGSGGEGAGEGAARARTRARAAAPWRGS